MAATAAISSSTIFATPGANGVSAVHHLVAAGDLLLDLETQVGKRGPPRRDDVPGLRQALTVIDRYVDDYIARARLKPAA